MNQDIVDYRIIIARYASMPNNSFAKGFAKGVWDMGTFEEACGYVEHEVGRFIASGYKPFGSLQIENAGGQIGSLAQPVVKYSE